jgi:ADP-glucose pyrophosphorylase
MFRSVLPSSWALIIMKPRGTAKNTEQIGRPNIGIGQGTVIECAIIDKNARIGRNVHIRCLPDRPDSERTTGLSGTAWS